MCRIYLIVAEKRSTPPKTKIDLGKLSPKELVAEFNDPNIWWRMTAQRLLLERQDKKAVPYLKSLSAKGAMPEARIHALRTLEALAALTHDQIKRPTHVKTP